jgi:hypothetical protein
MLKGFLSLAHKTVLRHHVSSPHNINREACVQHRHVLRTRKSTKLRSNIVAISDAKILKKFADHVVLMDNGLVGISNETDTEFKKEAGYLCGGGRMEIQQGTVDDPKTEMHWRFAGGQKLISADKVCGWVGNGLEGPQAGSHSFSSGWGVRAASSKGCPLSGALGGS